MQFKQIEFEGVIPKTDVPQDLSLSLPSQSNLPLVMQHFLFFIPWNEKYLTFVPLEYQDFFVQALPYLCARTTDVHVAVCFQYFDELLKRFADNRVNRDVVALALILHDAGWSRLSELEIAQSLGVSGLKLSAIANTPKERHVIESANIARQLIEESEYCEKLSDQEKELIIKAILNHDKPEKVVGAGNQMPSEVQLLVDIDHLWSFTHENFWQDTLRKGVNHKTYLRNLNRDLEGYFVTDAGKEIAKRLLHERRVEVEVLVGK